MIGHMCGLAKISRGARSADVREFRTWSECRVGSSLVYGGSRGSWQPLLARRVSRPPGRELGSAARVQSMSSDREEGELIDRRPSTTSLNNDSPVLNMSVPLRQAAQIWHGPTF